MAIKQHVPDLKGVSAFVVVLREVFTEQECRELIRLSQAQCYIPAAVNVGHGREIMNTQYRDSDCAIIDDADRARELF